MSDADVLKEYVTGRRLPDGRLAAVQRGIYNARVMAGLSLVGYAEHW